MRIRLGAGPIVLRKPWDNLLFANAHQRSFVRLAVTKEDVARSTTDSNDEQALSNRHGAMSRGKPYAYRSSEATFARHAVRAILRECTYLPDRFAAEYIKQHALSRFRTNGYKAWKDREAFEAHYTRRTKDARQTISILQRANEGERGCLLRVLHTAYGRIGKRRHELMRPLLSVNGLNQLHNASDASEEDPEAPEAASDGAQKARFTTKLSPSTPINITPQLRALLKSQMQCRPPDNIRLNPRRIEPLIPELNSWLRPTPQKVIRNMRKKHYAKLLDRVQAPLPFVEWQRLREFTSGKSLPITVISRRKQASPTDVGIASDRVSKTKQSALELVAQYGKVPQNAFGSGKARELSLRLMQRLYAEVFSQCPLMEWDTAAEKWLVTWGFQALVLDRYASRSGSTKPVPAMNPNWTVLQDSQIVTAIAASS